VDTSTNTQGFGGGNSSQLYSGQNPQGTSTISTGSPGTLYQSSLSPDQVPKDTQLHVAQTGQPVTATPVVKHTSHVLTLTIAVGLLLTVALVVILIITGNEKTESKAVAAAKTKPKPEPVPEYKPKPAVQTLSKAKQKKLQARQKSSKHKRSR
jgi:hypothetical protein